MNAGRQAGLAERARRHAALGEPVRLAIVDSLWLGDASPGELGRRLGQATNLMAHHLRVLTEAGLVSRVRSEGDARRSYVRLRLDDQDVADLLGTSGRRDAAAIVPARCGRVVFVCTHNSARSQLAAAAWSRISERPATSAGTHPASRVHPRAIEVGRRHGLRLGRARTRALADTISRGDLLVTVCDGAFEELIAEGQVRPWLHWSVPDPTRRGTDAAFDSACTALEPRVHRLAEAIEGTGRLASSLASIRRR